jgi:molybdenum cofactor cytidylyltransferase
MQESRYDIKSCDGFSELKTFRKERIVALILAAGRSTRMGVFKPLLPLGRRTILETILHRYRLAGISDILVVLGHRAEEVQTILDKSSTACVINDQYDEGMFSSIRVGAGSLSGACDAFFLHPADIPLVRPETLRRLISVRAETKKRILYPCYQQRRGHPPLICETMIPAILEFNEPGGMRALLRCYAQESLNVDGDDPGILADMDTKEDYDRFLHSGAGEII